MIWGYWHMMDLEDLGVVAYLGDMVFFILIFLLF